MGERDSCQEKEHLLKMVSDSGITKMAIHILGVTEQLGESLIMTIDAYDELKTCTCSPGR